MKPNAFRIAVMPGEGIGVEVMAAARDAGLVDNKVVAFSETHTSIRLVIPVADRPRA